jgi:hypothetical protein
MKHTLFIGSMLMTFVCFWATAAFAVRAIQLRKPGLPLFPTPLQSPFNHLFFTSHLSEAGMRARRLALVFGIGFLLFAALDFLLS